MSKPTFKVNHVQVYSPIIQMVDEGAAIELIASAISDAITTRNKQLEHYLRNFSEPQIKGEITKGKLRWRGIYFIEREEDISMAVFQRGKQISPFITIEFKQ